MPLTAWPRIEQRSRERARMLHVAIGIRWHLLLNLRLTFGLWDQENNLRELHCCFANIFLAKKAGVIMKHSCRHECRIHVVERIEIYIYWSRKINICICSSRILTSDHATSVFGQMVSKKLIYPRNLLSAIKICAAFYHFSVKSYWQDAHVTFYGLEMHFTYPSSLFL